MLDSRLGMHLLFYGKDQIKLLGTKPVEELLREQSIKVLSSFKVVFEDSLLTLHM